MKIQETDYLYKELGRLEAIKSKGSFYYVDFFQRHKDEPDRIKAAIDLLMKEKVRTASLGLVDNSLNDDIRTLQACIDYQKTYEEIKRIENDD